MPMAELQKSRCFLCRKRDTCSKNHKPIDQSTCPASKKCIRDVLEYLTRCTKSVLHLPRNEWLCLPCHSQICRYDNMMVSVLRQQRKLALMVEKASLDLGLDEDEDFIGECEMQMNDTLNEWNDADLMMAGAMDVSDNEIEQTMQEALGQQHTGNGGIRMNASYVQFKSKSGKDMVQCVLCAMKFRNKLRLQKHLAHTHKKFSCQICDYTHRNEDYVMLHQNTHEGRTETQCRFCYKDFSTRISTIRHMEVHFDTKKYQCDKCGLCFSQTTVLYNHKLQHEAEEKPLHCEICQQVFKTKRTFRHHQITHKADRPRYSCEYCGKTFTEKYTLKVHLRTHPETVGEMDNQTSMIQQQQQQQQLHQLVTSPVESRFACIICNSFFNCKDHLNRHMEREHDVILKAEPVTDAKKPCHVCGHMFSSQSNLDYHLEHMHGVSLT